LAEIILDLDFQYDAPLKDYCGSCRKCIEACPTQAISEKGYIMDGSKCISYLTIELKDEIPNLFKGQYKDWIFGCDICQEVCPWNKFSQPHAEPRFEPQQAFHTWDMNEWEQMDENMFNAVFGETPLTRAGWQKLKNSLGTD
jgi:epoxyqueuosine reductase